MANWLTVFTGAAGLNTRCDYARLDRDPETGIMELAEVCNVLVTNSRRLSRRMGAEQIADLPGHSVWSNGEVAIIATTAGALCLVDRAGGQRVLRSGLSAGKRVAFLPYTWAGNNGVHRDLFWSNGVQNGRIDLERLRNQSWFVDGALMEDGRQVSGNPPAGHLLALWDDRVWIAQSSGGHHVLWMTERYAPLLIRLSSRFIQLESRPTMLRAVEDGLFVSTSEAIFFYGGEGAENLSRRLVADYPAIEGTDVPVMGSEIGDGSVAGPGVLVTTPRGICFCGPGGYFRNLTRDRIEYPPAATGVAGIHDGQYHVYLHC